jgi:hypothetical protein
VNGGMSAFGTSRQLARLLPYGRFPSKADIGRSVEPADSVENEPQRSFRRLKRSEGTGTSSVTLAVRRP